MDLEGCHTDNCVRQEIYAPTTQKLRRDNCLAAHMDFKIDMSHRLTDHERGLLAHGAAHHHDQLQPPEVRPEGFTMLDMVAHAKGKYYEGNGHFHGTQRRPDGHSFYDKVTELHTDPYLADHYDVGKKYY